MSDKQILEWQEKVRQSFGDESKLYEYLFETMNNFYYRYIETSIHQNLKTKAFGPHTWGAESSEPSMMEVLKIKNPSVKKDLIEFAKSIPKSEGPEVHYSILADVKELTPNHGVIRFTATIDWGFPEFLDSSKRFQKTADFKYEDLAQFRKELALKLEDVCQIFL